MLWYGAAPICPQLICCKLCLLQALPAGCYAPTFFPQVYETGLGAESSHDWIRVDEPEQVYPEQELQLDLDLPIIQSQPSPEVCYVQSSLPSSV